MPNTDNYNESLYVSTHALSCAETMVMGTLLGLRKTLYFLIFGLLVECIHRTFLNQIESEFFSVCRNLSVQNEQVKNFELEYILPSHFSDQQSIQI